MTMLVAQMWGVLLGAFFIGLGTGWWIWRRAGEKVQPGVAAMAQTGDLEPAQDSGAVLGTLDQDSAGLEATPAQAVSPITRHQ